VGKWPSFYPFTRARTPQWGVRCKGAIPFDGLAGGTFQRLGGALEALPEGQGARIGRTLYGTPTSLPPPKI
jgi:hypothetical protein